MFVDSKIILIQSVLREIQPQKGCHLTFWPGKLHFCHGEKSSKCGFLGFWGVGVHAHSQLGIFNLLCNFWHLDSTVPSPDRGIFQSIPGLLISDFDAVCVIHFVLESGTYSWWFHNLRKSFSGILHFLWNLWLSAESTFPFLWWVFSCFFFFDKFMCLHSPFLRKPLAICQACL